MQAGARRTSGCDLCNAPRAGAPRLFTELDEGARIRRPGLGGVAYQSQVLGPFGQQDSACRQSGTPLRTRICRNPRGRRPKVRLTWRDPPLCWLSAGQSRCRDPGCPRGPDPRPLRRVGSGRLYRPSLDLISDHGLTRPSAESFREADIVSIKPLSESTSTVARSDS